MRINSATSASPLDRYYFAFGTQQSRFHGDSACTCANIPQYIVGCEPQFANQQEAHLALSHGNTWQTLEQVIWDARGDIGPEGRGHS
jgi:hypothetical protein